MTGMESLHFEFRGSRRPPPFDPVLVGVVSSGNLEVLIEPDADERCVFRIETSARGFGAIWEAVVRDFQDRHALAGTRISVHDMGATPAVVNLRLEQAVSALAGRAP